MSAPRPWNAWKRGPVPRTYKGDSELEHMGARGYLRGVTETWSNGWYAVMARPVETTWGTVTHVMVTNLPGTTVRDWPDLMRIKNELFGDHRTAVEVFPPRNEVVDQADMTHLWILPPEMTLPFTLIVPEGAR